MPRTRSLYPEAFRHEAICLAQLGDKPQRKLATDLGISDVTLLNCLREEKVAERKRPVGGAQMSVCALVPIVLSPRESPAQGRLGRLELISRRGHGRRAFIFCGLLTAGARRAAGVMPFTWFG